MRGRKSGAALPQAGNRPSREAAKPAGRPSLPGGRDMTNQHHGLGAEECRKLLVLKFRDRVCILKGVFSSMKVLNQGVKNKL